MAKYVIMFSFYCSEFTQEALHEIQTFNQQKSGDFRSMLINYVQLQLHMHKKVSGGM